MTTSEIRTAVLPNGPHGNGEWLQITPGERFRIRTSVEETEGAFAALKLVADPRNGKPMHVHKNEDEHFIVLEGPLHIANGGQPSDAPAGTAVIVRKSVPHAWCNLSEAPLRMLLVLSPEPFSTCIVAVLRRGLEALDPDYRGTYGMVHVQSAAEPHSFAFALLEGAQSVRLQRFPNPNGRMMEAAGGCAFVDETVRGGKRQSIFRSYVYALMDQPNITVLTGALATRILFNRRHATGVKFHYQEN